MDRVWLVMFGDFLAYWLSFFSILYLRFGESSYQGALSTHILPFTILYICWVLSFFLFDLYDLFTIKPTIPHIRKFGLAIMTSGVVGILLFYLLPMFEIAPKTNLAFQLIGFGILSFIFRRIVYILFSQQITRPIILVGETSYLKELHSEIEKNPQLGLKIISYSTNLHEVLEKYSTLKNSVFVFEGTLQTIPQKDIVTLYHNNTEIIDVAQAYERYFYKIPVDYISQTWLIENIHTKKEFVYESISRILDITASIIILVISFPFLLIAMIARVLEDGTPIFIKQKRVGLNGKVFNLYKMRSMVALSPDGSAETTQTKAVWSTGATDPRITPVGKVLRKLHIDEIPQMINIIRGDLAFVGPRPERPEFVSELEKTIPQYELRHIIKPGFTGWAQIKYHYANTTQESQEKFEYDLYYIKNRNMFMDLGIILRTIQIIFTH